MTQKGGEDDLRTLEYTSGIESRRPSRTLGVIAMMLGGISAVIQIIVMNFPWAVLRASGRAKALECFLFTMPVAGSALAFVGTKLRGSDRRMARIGIYVNQAVLLFFITALFFFATSR